MTEIKAKDERIEEMMARIKNGNGCGNCPFDGTGFCVGDDAGCEGVLIDFLEGKEPNVEEPKTKIKEVEANKYVVDVSLKVNAIAYVIAKDEKEALQIAKDEVFVVDYGSQYDPLYTVRTDDIYIDDIPKIHVVVADHEDLEFCEPTFYETVNLRYEEEEDVE